MEEMYTAKQDDENMTIALYVEEGSMHKHYKHFQVIIQVIPNSEGCVVKWIVEFEKHHGEIPDPRPYIEFFNKLAEKMNEHVCKAENCVGKAETEVEVKCTPHEFYETIKYSFHHLPTIFPEGCTDCKILEGDGKTEGTLSLWKYKLPGSDEELTVKARIAKQDDENMIIAFQVEEGDLHDHYRHFQVSVQVFPKGEGSLVKWVGEFEKHHDKIPHPHPYIDFVQKFTEKVDEHLHKA